MRADSRLVIEKELAPVLAGVRSDCLDAVQTSWRRRTWRASRTCQSCVRPSTRCRLSMANPTSSRRHGNGRQPSERRGPGPGPSPRALGRGTCACCLEVTLRCCPARQPDATKASSEGMCVWCVWEGRGGRAAVGAPGSAAAANGLRKRRHTSLVYVLE